MNQSNTAAPSSPKKENVLQFPKPEGFVGNTPEEIQTTLAENTAIWIDKLIPAVCSAAFNEISKNGINLFDPALSYDMLMVQEACRSLMHSSMKIDHPFQDLCREVLDMDEYGGVSIYKFSDIDFELDDDPEAS